MTKLKKLLALVLSVALLLSGGIIAFAENESSTAFTKTDALHTEGEKLVNRNGEEIILRGVNLGGWLIQEDWFCPADNGTRGDHYTLETLISRFGTEKAYELYNIYWDNWITEFDFAEIKNMGFNCVRIPFWYRNFQSDDNGTWIRNDDGKIDFSRLDWAVGMCEKYGIYAILDLHGANGGQGMADHCGQTGFFRFFDLNSEGKNYRTQAVELWSNIAERYAGNPAIAMFDLLNEPLCDVPLIKRNYVAVNQFYNDAYKAIREKDPDRVICMIGTWDIGKLPNPKLMCWNNVVYQIHLYNGSVDSIETKIAASKALHYNVPILIGEFHPTGENITLTLGEMIEVYEKENLSWCTWTWKGYNSWAAWADWFVYGSVNNELTVHPETDSFEEIAEKWGSMKTDSGVFYSGHMDEEVSPYLPDGMAFEKEPSTDNAFVRFFKNIAQRFKILIELIVNLFV